MMLIRYIIILPSPCGAILLSSSYVIILSSGFVSIRESLVECVASKWDILYDLASMKDDSINCYDINMLNRLSKILIE